MKIDEMVEQLLDMDMIKEDNSVKFSEDAKRLIHEIAEECKEFYEATKDRSEGYGDGLTAEQVYVDLLHKIVNAPTSLHMRMSARILIPIIDLKLREEDS